MTLRVCVYNSLSQGCRTQIYPLNNAYILNQVFHRKFPFFAIVITVMT